MTAWKPVCQTNLIR